MKKNRTYGLMENIGLLKMIKMMRFTIFILCLSLSQTFAVNSYSQQTKLSLDMRNARVEDVIDKIEKNSEFFFMYNKNMIDIDRKVNLIVDEKSITQILDKLFENTEISYSIKDRQILLINRRMAGIEDEAISQQQKTVSGKVVDSTGEPLPGVSVVVKGTSTGVIADMDGKYILSKVPENATLQFSFVGMKMIEVNVAGKSKIDVILVEETKGIEEVVVTALGIEKQSKALSYSTQKINGSELNRVAEPNVMNSLAGKIAGITINRSSVGLGGSVKVTLRGNKSVQGNNQPLYIVDGVPIQSYSNGGSSNNTFFSGSDFGDGISNLNPNDIESLTVLKGASAAALYGSSAANGVVLITTKKGAAGQTKVDFSTNSTLDKVAYTPELQNSYGQTSPGSEESWGSKITNARDNISEFFQTGFTTVNNIALSTATEKISNYFSYSNTLGKGIIENHTLGRHNFNFRQNARFLNNKLSLDGHINYIIENNSNSPGRGEQTTPMRGLYLFPRGLDITPYKNNYAIHDVNRNMDTQNWPFISQINQNPYWMINKMLNENKRDRLIISLAARYNITNWINFQVRGNMDRINDFNTMKFYAGTDKSLATENGKYQQNDNLSISYYGDAILNFTKTFGKIDANVIIGTSISDQSGRGNSAQSQSINIPNFFALQNFLPGGYFSSWENHSQLQAVFGNINISYKDMLFFEMSGRNDWSSNLSFTPNVSYFYPSAGLSLVLTKALKLPEVISFAKLKGSYAIVGNSVPSYVTHPLNSVNNGILSFNNVAPFSDLQPEKTHSFEFGAEIRLFEDRLNIDIDYYKTNTKNQFFTVTVPPGTGYSSRYINGGNIQNSGIETSLGYKMVSKGNLKWNTNVNFSTNKNLILELANNVDQYSLVSDVNGYFSILKVNGSYGDIYGSTLKHDDQGRVVFSASNGAPIKESGAPVLLGNSNPDFILGWNNEISLKNFSLSFLFDGSFGGKVLSLVEPILDFNGVSKTSGIARDNGGVKVNGVVDGTGAAISTVDAQKWFQGIGGRQVFAASEYMYDATVVRLREISLGYSFANMLKHVKLVKSVKLSLVGRNLMYLYKKAPFDPELTYSSGNGYSGVDVFSSPATRSIGVNLNVSF